MYAAGTLTSPAQFTGARSCPVHQASAAATRSSPACFSGRVEQHSAEHTSSQIRNSLHTFNCCSSRKARGSMVLEAASAAVEPTSEPLGASSDAKPGCLICTIVTADSLEGALQEVRDAAAAKADVVELRLDYLRDMNFLEPEGHLSALLEACKGVGLPCIVTLRPTWEGGKFAGPEEVRLAILKYAAVLGAAYVDVEFLAADYFFAGGDEDGEEGVPAVEAWLRAGEGQVPISTKVILSHHDYDETPDDDVLEALVEQMFEGGADIAKIATMARRVEDSARMLALPDKSSGPTIALAMGEKGLPSRLLAARAGAYLTFGALSPGQASAPGQPTVEQLRSLYRLPAQSAATKVFGIVGNPVSHSRSPALHNAAFAAAKLDAVYVPLLVDELAPFLAAFPDCAGFSVTIPHKVAALECADEADEVAARIGAANTLVRNNKGQLKAYNTDWSAAIGAVEAALGPGPNGSGASPLNGLTAVVLGAGGAGRALAFGAAERGARVIVCNRTREKAESLAAALGGAAEVADYADVAAGNASGDVLMNSTSIGMSPADSESPVEAGSLKGYKLVFDAVYTPLETRLLKDAQAAGCATVSGLEMFVGQAAEQYELFTGQPAPVDVMRQATLDSLAGH